MTDQSTETAPEFDIDRGDWRVTGSYGNEDNITVYYQGSVFRRFTYPAYKIWNIPAHLDEWVERFEELRATAGSSEVSGA